MNTSKLALLVFQAIIFFNNSLYALYDVPLKREMWQDLSYSGIAANKVSFENNLLQIRVNSSAGPLIHPLVKPTKYQKLRVKAQIVGNLKLKQTLQGSKENDDFRLRVGIVYEGKQTLGFIKRQFAPSWVKRLFNLAPEGVGVDHIEFFNTFSDKRIYLKSRTHPLSDLLQENFLLRVSKQGNIDQVVEIPFKSRVIALWISSDGDDTHSRYLVKVKKIILF